MDNLVEIISGFILGLAVISPFLLVAKKALKEVGELLLVLSSGLEDGKITMDEAKDIVAAAGDIIGVFKK